MRETLSWERARTANVGVRPHGAQGRRRTGIIGSPSHRGRSGERPAARVFLPGPVPLDPLAPAAVIALFSARLRALPSEAARPEQAAHVIGMVDDLEVMTD